MLSPPSGRRLLLIDDDELSRAVLELHLSAAGYAILTAESGEEALAWLGSAAAAIVVDIILCDLQMPGLSGPALAAQLRGRLAPDTRLVAMSGSKPPADRIAGFDHFLLKPFTPDQLAEALHTAVPAATSTASTSAAEAAPALDHTVFAQLAASMKPAQLAELFNLAFAELERHTVAMTQALAAHDDAALRANAHAVKGSFGMLGARELHALAAQLETGTLSPADQAASLGEIHPAAQRLRRMLSSHQLAP